MSTNKWNRREERKKERNANREEEMEARRTGKVEEDAILNRERISRGEKKRRRGPDTFIGRDERYVSTGDKTDFLAARGLLSTLIS